MVSAMDSSAADLPGDTEEDVDLSWLEDLPGVHSGDAPAMGRAPASSAHDTEESEGDSEESPANRKKLRKAPTTIESSMVKILPGGMTAELIFSQMEAKVAHQCIRIMEPHVSESKANASQLEGLWSLSKENSSRLTKLDHLFRELQEGLLQIRQVREEMDDFRIKAQEQEMSQKELVSDIKTKVQNISIGFGKKDEAMMQQDAKITHVGSEVVHLKEVLESAVEAFHKSLEEKFHQIGSMKANLETQVAGVEMKHNRLVDQVWEGETALARLAADLRHFKQDTELFKEVATQFTKEREQQAKLEKLQTDLVDWLGKTRFELSDTKKQVADGIEQAKASVKLGLQMASDQVASFMEEVRKQKEAHLETYAIERAGTQEACKRFEAELEGFADIRAGADKRMKGIIQEMQEGVEEEGRRRKREKASLETEIKIIGEKMLGLFKTVDEAVSSCKAVEPLCDAILQAAEMQLCLEKQDAADWAKASLVGYNATSATSNRVQQNQCKKCTETKMASTTGSFSPASSPGKSPRHQRPVDTSGVVTIDRECFSCSDQREMVLQGFKMACLHYNPSPVRVDRYASEPLSREELFEQMEATLIEGRYRVDVLKGRVLPKELGNDKQSPRAKVPGNSPQLAPQKRILLPTLSPRR